MTGRPSLTLRSCSVAPVRCTLSGTPEAIGWCASRSALRPSVCCPDGRGGGENKAGLAVGQGPSGEGRDPLGNGADNSVSGLAVLRWAFSPVRFSEPTTGRPSGYEGVCAAATVSRSGGHDGLSLAVAARCAPTLGS